MPPFPLLYYAQNNSNSTPPNKSKDHCVKNNVHFYNKKWNVSWRWKNLSYHHVTTVAVLFCYFRCCLLYSIAISLSSVVACRNNVIHQSFNLREGVDRFKECRAKKVWENNIYYFILKAFFLLNRDEDKLFGLYWCLCVPSSFIILSCQLTAKNVVAGSVTDERLNSLVILHVH